MGNIPWKRISQKPPRKQTFLNNSSLFNSLSPEAIISQCHWKTFFTQMRPSENSKTKGYFTSFCKILSCFDRSEFLFFKTMIFGEFWIKPAKFSAAVCVRSFAVFRRHRLPIQRRMNNRKDEQTTWRLSIEAAVLTSFTGVLDGFLWKHRIFSWSWPFSWNL